MQAVMLVSFIASMAKQWPRQSLPVETQWALASFSAANGVAGSGWPPAAPWSCP